LPIFDCQLKGGSAAKREGALQLKIEKIENRKSAIGKRAFFAFHDPASTLP